MGCYFCDEMGHVLMDCPARVGCMACGSDMHRFEKCVHRTVTCSPPVGHVSKIHQTTARELIKRLLAAHPHQFDHFLPQTPMRNRQGLVALRARSSAGVGDTAAMGGTRLKTFSCLLFCSGLRFICLTSRRFIFYKRI